MRHPADLRAAMRFKAVGDIVGGVFGGGQPPVVLPAPQEQPAPPTVDEAAQAAESERQLAKRKGRLATFLSPASTSAQLNAGPQESALKKMLGS